MLETRGFLRNFDSIGVPWLGMSHANNPYCFPLSDLKGWCLMSDKSELIAQQNDQFRRSLGTDSIPGRVVTTMGFAALEEARRNAIVQAVIDFETFTEDNDPYGEHDFGVIALPEMNKVYWKIDYYDASLEQGSEDPTDLEQTQRVLTIMLASEY
jgi:hypothetical protein